MIRRITDAIIDIKIPCKAVFSAAFFFLSPKNLEILLPIPTEIPILTAIRIKNRGNEKDKAAIASLPNLPTKAVSIILYNECADIEIRIGIANFTKDFSGFLINSFTFFIIIKL